MEQKEKPFPQWAGGVWYDPLLLPTKKGKSDPFDGIETWDVIVKGYDAEKDEHTYTRISDCAIAANWKNEKDNYRISEENRLIEWSFYTKDGDGLPKNTRVVAIMPRPTWKEVYEKRLTTADTLRAISADAPGSDWNFRP